jgi:branched-chain amino acid aminotransferase
MQQSAAHLDMGYEKPAPVIRNEIAQLVRKNRLADINVKLLYTETDASPLFLTYFIHQDFPAKEDYSKGARTILYTGERKDPQVKTVGTSYRERVRVFKESAGAYEALLVNEAGYVCEGTRSNVFFLKDDQLSTSPSDEVLLGVTRRYVLKVCSELGITVTERMFHHRELKNLQGAFITGTTIDVLPIGYIDDLYLPSVQQPVINKIAKAFSGEVSSYIESHRDESSPGSGRQA